MAGATFNGTYGARILLSDPALQNPATLAITGLIDVATGDAVDGTAAAYWNFTNLGTASATAGLGIRLASGTITNGSQTNRKALIEGDYGGVDITQGVGAIANFATIASAEGTGLALQNGGTVLNSGTIIGGAARGAAVDIGAGAAPSLVVNDANGMISGTDVGIGITNGTITNFGTIESTTTGVAGLAVNLRSGGLLNNYGTIRGAASPAAGVVAVHNEPGTIRNFGVIASTVRSNAINLISGGTVINGAPGQTAAQIIGSNAGIYVSPYAYGVTPTGLSLAVLNYATIVSGYMAAIGSMAGGSVVNHGLISGAQDGIAFRKQSAGAIVNYGTLESNTSGSVGSAVHLSGGGSIDNLAGALITGDGAAILAACAPVTIANDGTIDGGIAAMQSIRIAAGGVVRNGQIGNPGALIAGPQIGIRVVAGATTLVNFGTIVGTGTAGTGVQLYCGDTTSHTITNAGIIIGNGGTAIQLSGGNDTLALEAGSALVGAIANMHPGDTIDLPFLTFVNAGTITPDAGNVLHVVEGAASYALHFDPAQNFTGHLFLEAADAAGGTTISETSIAADVVIPISQTAAYPQAVPLSSIFSVSGPTASQYQVWLDGPADGAVTDSNGPIATDAPITETSLAKLTYSGGGAAGQDQLWLRAFDGQWSSWVLATLTDPGVTPDSVAATSESVAYQQAVGLGDLFSVSGPTPSRYQVWLAGPADGAVSDGNGPIATNTAVDETSLGNLTYTGGGAAGQDQLWLRAFDGQWSGWALATLTDPGVTPDSVAATSESVAYQQAVGLGDLFSVSGPAPSRYQVWLAGPADGVVIDGSGPIATNTAVDETSLGNLTYTGGGATRQDQLWLRAFDGQWSSWALATLTDSGVTPDSVVATSENVAYQQAVGLGDLFTVSGPTPSRYQVWLAGAADGAVSDGSGAIATNTAVDETSLGNLTYTGGGAAGQDQLWLRAFDGQWSSWALATLTDPGVTPPIVTPTEAARAVAAGTVIPAQNLFSVSDNSAALINYGFWDLGSGGGHFTVGGVAQGVNQEIDVAAGQLSQVDYVAGSATDTLWVRASDGHWGNWSAAFTVTG